MEIVNLTIFIISFLVFIFGAFIGYIDKWPLSEPLLAMIAGITCGPFVLDLLNLNEWGDTHSIMLVATRLTIAMALMATALRLPANYFRKYFRSQSILVMGAMLLMWGFSTGLFWLIFQLPFIVSALIGAIITPTDPVVASSIVSGKFAQTHFSEKIRNSLSFESGTNDGLAFPLVALPILILSQTNALQHWILISVLWETLAGIAIGYITGIVAGKLVNKAHKHHWMTEKSLLAASLTLAFVIISGFELIQVNSILAVFVGGVGFNTQIDQKEELEDEKVQEMLERLFVVPIFFFLGLILPFDLWQDQGWLLVLFVTAILLFRRIPGLFILKKYLRRYNTADVFVLGWLGPIGVSSLFYAFHAMEKIEYEMLWIIVSAVVFGSTVVHGITASLVGKWFKKNQAN